jgi:hypothetical protein
MDHTREETWSVFFVNEAGERCIWGAGKFLFQFRVARPAPDVGTRSALTDVEILRTSTIGAQDLVNTNTRLGTGCSLFANIRRR